MSGNCATGIARRESSPAIAVTSAITIASRGRSTKIDENIALTTDRFFNWRGCHRDSRPKTLHATDDDKFPARKAIGDNDRTSYHLPHFQTPDRRFPVLDDENVNTLLIRDQCGLWYDHTLLRFVTFHTDLNELSVDKPVFRIWNRRTHRNRVGGAIHFHIDEIDLSRVRVDRSV